MLKPLDAANRLSLLRLSCFFLMVVAVGVLFLGTPALTVPSLCSIMLVTLLSPWVTALERLGFSRRTSIAILIGGFALIATGLGLIAFRNWQQEWWSFQEKAPDYFTNALAKLGEAEARIKIEHPIFNSLHLTATISDRGKHFGSWFERHFPGIFGDFMSCVFLVPILTFCLLSEGRKIRRSFFQLVPNRFFESVYTVTHGISTALSDYLRAKLIEAFLVGAITTLGLALIGSPYAVVLGFWAGVTNIIPYLGPVIGAAPGILIAFLDGQGQAAGIWEIVTVYGLANMIDMVLIFPGVVAKLVRLNPLVLIASVVLGQYYYGIVGMLISIPIAATIKVVLGELYVIVYGY